MNFLLQGIRTTPLSKHHVKIIDIVGIKENETNFKQDSDLFTPRDAAKRPKLLDAPEPSTSSGINRFNYHTSSDVTPTRFSTNYDPSTTFNTMSATRSPMINNSNSSNRISTSKSTTPSLVPHLTPAGK